MSHPYRQQGNEAFWSRGVAAHDPRDINPALPAPFTLSPRDKIVTAGSCFAQNISPRLPGMGLHFLVTEPAHPVFPAALAARFGYGLFSARYGNLYTARQLLQLCDRAYGVFQPREDVWSGQDGAWIDPFRPRIQPRGFLTAQEYEADRDRHFAAVREAFETMDVFIFTLGLTECWRARADGAVFPLCPGVAGGVYDPARHEFHNFAVDEVMADLLRFIDAIRRRNPACRFIFTVSPVPLVATARRDAHVMVASDYSKAVLRVAAQMAVAQREDSAYFPAYEIITSAATPHYFAADQRSVTPAGVDHVMRCFAASFTGHPPPRESFQDHDATMDRLARMEEAMRVDCDELALDPDYAHHTPLPSGRDAPI